MLKAMFTGMQSKAQRCPDSIGFTSFTLWNQPLCHHEVITDQFVLFDEAAKLSAGNQLAPLSQDQLRAGHGNSEQSA